MRLVGLVQGSLQPGRGGDERSKEASWRRCHDGRVALGLMKLTGSRARDGQLEERASTKGWRPDTAQAAPSPSPALPSAQGALVVRLLQTRPWDRR